MEASAKNSGRCREPGALVGVSVYKLCLWADSYSSDYMNYVAFLEERKSVIKKKICMLLGLSITGFL